MVKKGQPTPRLVSFRGLMQNVREASPPLSYVSPPGKKYTCCVTLRDIVWISVESKTVLDYLT